MNSCVTNLDILIQKLNVANNVATYTTVDDNKWHFVVATFDNSIGTSIYIDSILEETRGNYTNNREGTGSDIFVGYRERDVDDDEYFNGTMDEVFIYNKTLSAREIKELYIKGLPVYSYTAFQEIVTPVTNYTFQLPAAGQQLISFELNYSASANDFYTPIVEGDISLSSAQLDIPIPPPPDTIFLTLWRNLTSGVNVSSVDTLGNWNMKNINTTGNVTTAGTFFGKFGWFIDSFSLKYLTFNTTHLFYNESNLNATIRAYDNTTQQMIDAVNSTGLLINDFTQINAINDSLNIINGSILDNITRIVKNQQWTNNSQEVFIKTDFPKSVNISGNLSVIGKNIY